MARVRSKVRWRGAVTIAALAVGGIGWGAGVAAQTPPDSVDNLQHRPGTRTVPLGRLGHVEKRGSGPVPMILVPGASFGWRVWEGFMARNADRYTMWAITPPGYDRTDPPPMPPADDFSNRVWSDALIEAIADLMDREGIERPIVVGHHLLGDYYALRLALEYGDEVAGVAIMAGYPARPIPLNFRADQERPATSEERLRWVHENQVPFFRTVTDSVWRTGTFPATAMSRDPEVGRALFEDQISTPLPIQIRYFLEYLTDDLRPRLPGMTVPVIAFFQSTSLSTLIEQNREALVARFGSVEAARDSILASFGGDEEALENARNPWGGLPSPPPDLVTVPVDRTGLFLMHDRPDLIDRELASWVARVRPRGR